MSHPGPNAPAPPGGLDETLFDELARMTPEERLRWNDRAAATILELRHALASGPADQPARPPRGERG